jgi:protein tyrosine phosphatase (PTP) superfamily phosphohydrolase (DUF442 family)
MRRFGALLVALVCCLPSAGRAEDKLDEKVQKCELGGIKQIHRLGDIYLAGQPTKDDLKIAKDKGLKTIVSVRGKNEIEWDEAAAAKELGIEYVHLPFTSADTLTDAIFADARKVLRDKSKRPLMMH